VTDPPTSQLNHILPQRYQAGFAGPDGCVWVSDRRRGAIACEHPKRVAAERDFYTWDIPKSRDAIEIESFLAEEIEVPCWTVIEKLERQEIPTSSDRLRISFFASFFLTRVPAFRDGIAKCFSDAMLASDLRTDLDSLSDFIRRSSGGLFVPRVPKNQALRQMLRLGFSVGKHLTTLNTHLIYSPASEPFITSDNPFVFVRMVNDDQMPTVSATSFLKLIPFSARLTVGFGLPGDEIMMSNANPLQTRRSNLGLATAAREIVLAKSREQLEEILSAVPNDKPAFALAFPSVIP
jgi:hypothetical protein